MSEAPRRRTRLERLAGFIARSMGKGWDRRAGAARSAGDSSPGPSPSSARSAPSAGSAPGGPSSDSVDPVDSADSADPFGRPNRARPLGSPRRHGSENVSAGPGGAPRTRSGARGARGSAQPADEQVTSRLTLERIESMLASEMSYRIRREEDQGHATLMGNWDGFPFIIEIPAEHDGWLLISGDWAEPGPEGQRDELASAVNDWNRDRYFPTVAIVDGPEGPFIRAIYITDLRAGITDDQLRLHLDTALASCTQALRAIAPLLPEL
ncbi:YbjN domain-containing protein [Actinomyces sp. zg296]|uniref:YbjN domain-containing protein n=1 Tax=Actinomyces sp. zg296 TaxID=2609289 RepID=UPI001F21DCB5|nr:YbjN domain-containing protein [Actinomyces sp. zg296]